MSPDPERAAETRQWMVKARHDLLAASTLLQASPSLPDIAAYHCQQAVEKALKAFLFWHDKPFRKTHDLEMLGLQCLGIDAELETLLDQAAVLTPLAWQYRYPGPVAEPTTDDALEALELARGVVDAIAQRLPREVNA